MFGLEIVPAFTTQSANAIMLGASLTVVEDDESDKESVDKGLSMNPDPRTI